jgi:uncharacterized protein (DUF1330 family)
MNNQAALALALLTGFALGAGATQGLHAQSRPLAYVISEIEMMDQEAYGKEYLPLAQKALRDSGQKVLASGGTTAAFYGEPPKPRIVLSVFENIDKARAAYTSPDYVEARRIADKYAKLRIFAVEGAPQ